MTAVQMCFWLQGLFELANPTSLDARQTDLIRRHLAMVFKHEIDPSYPAEQQQILDDIHAGKIEVVPYVDVTKPTTTFQDSGHVYHTTDPHNVKFRC